MVPGLAPSTRALMRTWGRHSCPPSPPAGCPEPPEAHSLIPKLGCTVRSEKDPLWEGLPPRGPRGGVRTPAEVSVPEAWWRGSLPPTSPFSRKLLEPRSFPETVIWAGAAPDARVTFQGAGAGVGVSSEAQCTMALPGRHCPWLWEGSADAVPRQPGVWWPRGCQVDGPAPCGSRGGSCEEGAQLESRQPDAPQTSVGGRLPLSSPPTSRTPRAERGEGGETDILDYALWPQCRAALSQALGATPPLGRGPGSLCCACPHHIMWILGVPRCPAAHGTAGPISHPPLLGL